MGCVPRPRMIRAGLTTLCVLAAVFLGGTTSAQLLGGISAPKGEQDSTGTEINDIANHWKKVGVLNQIQLQAYTYTNITTLANTSLKASAGTLARIAVNTVGAAGNTITIKDTAAADCSGGVTIGTISFGSGVLGTVLTPVALPFDAATINGLCITTATGTAPNITVMWR